MLFALSLFAGCQALIGSCEAVANERLKIFIGYIDKDPQQPPTTIVSILDNLSPQLGGLAPKIVTRLSADWSISTRWKQLGADGYTHFVVGGADAVTELQNRYKQPSWIIGRIARDQDSKPHLTYYGLLSVPIWTSKDNSDLFKYVCEDQRTPIANGAVDCMIPVFAPNAASLLRDQLYFIFPELREKYVFLLRCVQAAAIADSEDALSITQRLWDNLSGFVEPSADWWNDAEMLKRACRDAAPAILKPPEFEIRGYFNGRNKKGLNLNIVNHVWDRRDDARYKWALGDDATSEEAHKWREQLELWRRKSVKCTVDTTDPPDWDDLVRHLAPHLSSVILSVTSADSTPWSCDP